MAIVNSLAVGKATKTAGELTYAKVRGRTIARRRIIANKSNTAAQGAQRFTFGVVSSMAAILDPYIKQNFEPTEYGSARNCFLKRNWPFLKSGYQTDNPAEMSTYTVLFDIINAGGYAQYGVGYEGSVEVYLDDTSNIHTSLEIIDKGYKSVELYVVMASNQSVSIYKRASQPTLVNDVWQLVSNSAAPAAFNYFVLLVYIDGKPIINNSAYCSNSEEGGGL